MTIAQEIARTRASLASAKPRSKRHAALETRLCLLVARQIRAEVRQERKRQ
jgi:hypothetical protein